MTSLADINVGTETSFVFCTKCDVKAAVVDSNTIYLLCHI